MDGRLLGAEIVIPLVEHLEGLGRLGREGSPPSEALEDDGAQTPQVRFGVVVQGHDHFRGL